MLILLKLKDMNKPCFHHFKDFLKTPMKKNFFLKLPISIHLLQSKEHLIACFPTKRSKKSLQWAIILYGSVIMASSSGKFGIPLMVNFPRIIHNFMTVSIMWINHKGKFFNKTTEHVCLSHCLNSFGFVEKKLA